MTDFARHMEPVARLLLGEPNRALSTPSQWRYGTHGSMAVEVAGGNGGTWYDHERKVGGGVLDLVRDRLGLSNGAAVDWLTSELRLDEQPEPVRERRIIAQYDYRDEAGELVFQVVRYDPKDFKQRRPDGKGGWDWSIKGVRQVPYRLNAILERPEGCPIFVVEGEKDADRLASLGLVATCNAGGAGKWRAELSTFFCGATVYVLPDQDDAGHQHAQQVAASLLATAESVRVVELPGLPHKGDVSNWLDGGGDAGRLLELCQAAPLWSAETEVEVEAAADADLTFIAHDVDDLDRGEIPPREWLLSNFLCRCFVTLLAASGGCGKTSLLIVWALSLAIGRALTGDHVFKRSRVLILTFEDDLEECRRRLRAARMHHGIAEVGRGWCHVVSLAGIGITLATSQKGGSLVETDAAQQIIGLIRRLRADVAMFDPLVKLSDGDENDNRASDFLARILVRIAIETNVAVLVTHHFRKGVATAGDIDAARGARAIIDASRAALTLLPMTVDEAKRFELSEEERRRLVRLDIGKANLALPAENVRWYRLVSVPIDNPTDDYPHGDSVQALERWEPPDVWESLSNNLLNGILDVSTPGCRTASATRPRLRLGSGTPGAWCRNTPLTRPRSSAGRSSPPGC